MNLQKLFEIQRILDEKIVKEKGLEGHDLLDKKILALQVELGELANNWRGFKYWSYNQKPKTEELGECPLCNGTGDLGTVWAENCIECGGTGKVVVKNPLLEEFADCLHFLLSVGLESEIGTFTGDELIPIKMGTIEMQFITLFNATVTFLEDISYYQEMWELFLGLGEMLGFNWEEVEQAYYAKNKENHERQENGY